MNENEEQGYVFVEADLNGEDDELYPLPEVEQCSACGYWHPSYQSCPPLQDAGGLK
jgi:hypothetical protein